jgi:hypothetical protein
MGIVLAHYVCRIDPRLVRSGFARFLLFKPFALAPETVSFLRIRVGMPGGTAISPVR